MPLHVFFKQAKHEGPRSIAHYGLRSQAWVAQCDEIYDAWQKTRERSGVVSGEQANVAKTALHALNQDKTKAAVAKAKSAAKVTMLAQKAKGQKNLA